MLVCARQARECHRPELLVDPWKCDPALYHQQGLECYFPLFQVPYEQLQERLWRSKVRVRIKTAPHKDWIGKSYDPAFVKSLPDTVDAFGYAMPIAVAACKPHLTTMYMYIAERMASSAPKWCLNDLSSWGCHPDIQCPARLCMAVTTP